MDELSTLGDSQVAEFYQEKGFSVTSLSPKDLPVTSAKLEDLAGGEAADNAAITTSILKGEETGPKLDAVLLNSGAALFVAGKADSISGGWELAQSVISDGRAAAKLADLASA